MDKFIAGACNIDFNSMSVAEKMRLDEQWARHQLGLETTGAKAARYATALRAIIERADNGALGSSKVQDMNRIATDALAD